MMVMIGSLLVAVSVAAAPELAPPPDATQAESGTQVEASPEHDVFLPAASSASGAQLMPVESSSEQVVFLPADPGVAEPQLLPAEITTTPEREFLQAGSSAEPQLLGPSRARPPVQVPRLRSTERDATSSRPRVQRPRDSSSPTLLLPAERLDPTDTSRADEIFLLDVRTRPAAHEQLLPTVTSHTNSAAALVPAGEAKAPVRLLPVGDP